MNFYRITPEQKKSIEYFVDVYTKLPDDTIRGFEVAFVYRWGQAYRTEDDPVYTFEKDCVHCRPDVGLDNDLDDLCAVHVTFDDSYTDDEKENIESILSCESEDENGLCGIAWIYDGDHEYEIDHDHITVLGPFRVDLVDKDGTVIQEDVKLEV